MVDSLDRLIMNVGLGGSNVLGENGGAMKIGGGFARTSVVDTDTFKSRNARAAVAQLRGRSALPRMQELFVGYMHPDVSFDLRSESNLAGVLLDCVILRMATPARVFLGWQHLGWCYRSV